MIVARSLTKHYGDGAARVAGVRDVCFEIEAGERVALVGRSGSGKTTLLNLLAGLDHPSSGELDVAGASIGSQNAREMADYRLSKVGVVFQSFQLLPQRTAFENVELPLILSGRARSERHRIVAETLDRVGLSARVHHRPAELSGGEQQRVAIARAIVHRPPVLLADEPTGNLDTRSADVVTELILEVTRETGATFVLITHDRALAKRCGQRCFSLVDGELETSGEAA